MSFIKHKKCKHKDCNKRPNYGIIGTKTPIYCAAHKDKDMVNVTSKKCIHSGCTVTASYNFINENMPIYCKTHMKDGMVSKKAPLCKYTGCHNYGIYAFKDNKLYKYCHEHKTDEMINVNSNYCVHKNCTTRGNYKSINDSNIYCALHKPLESSIYNRCIEANCKKDAIFKPEKSRKLLYCVDHKKENNVKCSQKCMYDNCEKIGSYCYKHYNKEIYCKTHKKDGMMYYRNKCAYNGRIVITEDNGDEIEFLENTICTNNPQYIHPETPSKMYCFEHKLDGMVKNKTVAKRKRYECNDDIESIEDTENIDVEDVEDNITEYSKTIAKRKKYTDIDYEHENGCSSIEHYDIL
jgi:L-rhamnose mutarotase